MKKLFVRILCLALCAFAPVCSAALAEPAFTLDSDGYITEITMDSEAQTLIIPGEVGGTDVRGIRAGVFSSYPRLKCILVEVDTSAYRFLKDKSLDFTSAPNLECIYFVADVSYIYFHQKIVYSSGVDIRQYLSLSGKEIAVDSIAYENGLVNLIFTDIIPDGYYGYNYHITRTAQGSEESVIYTSEADFVNFTTSNGRVRFIDSDVEPGQEYCYSIVATDPFGSTSIPCTASISIPAAGAAKHPLPETGDGATPVLWAALAMMSAAGMLSILRKKAA